MNSSILYMNEQRGAYPNSYYVTTTQPLPACAPLKGNRKTDVCIVGGGFSGLSAALHLRQRGFDVTLIDAQRLGWGASGRNGGQVGSDQRVEQIELVERVGAEHARRLWGLAEDSKALVASLIRDHDIECDYRPGIIHANHKRSFGAESKAYVAYLHEQYDYQQIRYVPEEEMRSTLATEAYFDGTYDAGAHYLNPFKYVQGLAKACLAAGVDVYEQTEALEIRDGDPVVVRTPDAQISASYLVLAVNGYGGRLNPRVADRVMPINNYIIATEPLSEELATSLIANDAAVADSKFVINYYHLSVDRRLIFGGRESYRYRFPPDIKAYVRRAMLSIYPQLADAKIDFGWGGALGITMSRMPYFEFLTPNTITIGGYSGHGVPTATLGGALAAEAIAGVAERFDVLAKIPALKFPGGGHARLPLLAMGMAYYSLRDRIGS